MQQRKLAGFRLACVCLLLSACASQSPTDQGSPPAPSSRYSVEQDFSPGVKLDPDLIADAVPRNDPIVRAGNTSPYTVLGKTYTLLPSAKHYRERGYASWYGMKFHGHKTANGEIYDAYAMTAAHKTLPIPSYVRVTNLENQRSTIVRVNDRGPFHSGRIIDLSYAAASKLKLADTGTAMVEVSSLDLAPAGPRSQAPQGQAPDTAPVDTQSVAGQWVQVGVFADYERALAIQGGLVELVPIPVVISRAGSDAQLMHRVRIGPLRDNADLDAVTAALLLQNITDAKLVNQ